MYGYKNEYNFCNLFDQRFVYQLNDKLVEFLEDIFERKLDKKNYVRCFKSFAKDKTDVTIRIGKEKKNISIKSGKNNSIHLERLNSFLDFLKENDCPNELMYIYKDYHLGYDPFGNRMSGKDYQFKFSSDLEKLNAFFNQEVIRKKAINRFLFDGVNQKCNSSDVIIYGTHESFYYATKSQIIEYLLNMKDSFLSPHFSALVLQPWTRNLNYNPKYEYRRGFVQVKWYRLNEVMEKIGRYICIKK